MVYNCSMGARSLGENMIDNVTEENKDYNDSFTTEMLAHGQSEFEWAVSILMTSAYHQTGSRLSICIRWEGNRKYRITHGYMLYIISKI